MKTIIYSVIAIAVMLTLCFIVSLVRNKSTETKMHWTNLILPLVALMLFVGLFIGGSIARSNIRKELVEMKESTEKSVEHRSRLTVLEERNKTISRIIGRDKALEKQIEALR